MEHCYYHVRIFHIPRYSDHELIYLYSWEDYTVIDIGL